MGQERNQIQFKGKPLDSVYTADVLDNFGDDIDDIVERAQRAGIQGDEEEIRTMVETVFAQISQGLSNKQDAITAVDSLGRTRDGSPTESMKIYEMFVEPFVEEPVLPEGKMYKVGLQPNPEDMMDYQLPIAEQDEKFLNAFKNIYHDRIKKDPDLAALYPTPESLTMKDMGLFDKSIVGQVYNTFSKELFQGDEAALTQALLEQGVPGIKYRDAGSRGGSKTLKDATFNYVVFDDKAIKILEKYGVAGPVAVTALASQQTQDDDARVANAPKI